MGISIKTITATIFLTMMSETVMAVSPFISEVYDYLPAPGQFVNLLPETDETDTPASVLAKVKEEICGEATPGVITLGGFGGYVIFGFDHPVVNLPGEYDFKIYGNATISSSQPYGGSCEPGVVWVSVDENGNGLPDDRWYQLAGSEYNNAATIHNISITYRREKPVSWSTDNPARPEGTVPQNQFHPQSYWPLWITDNELTFSGTTLLPDNAVDVSGNSSYWVLAAYEYGYADNLPNNQDKGFDLSWAVNPDGTPASLSHIDFVKVQTGVLQIAGWLGEVSTEVCGAEDLHPEASSVIAIDSDSKDDAITAIYTMDGRLLPHTDQSRLQSGMYVIKTPHRCYKLRI